MMLWILLFSFFSVCSGLVVPEIHRIILTTDSVITLPCVYYSDASNAFLWKLIQNGKSSIRVSADKSKTILYSYGWTVDVTNVAQGDYTAVLNGALEKLTVGRYEAVCEVYRNEELGKDTALLHSVRYELIVNAPLVTVPPSQKPGIPPVPISSTEDGVTVLLHATDVICSNSSIHATCMIMDSMSRDTTVTWMINDKSTSPDKTYTMGSSDNMKTTISTKNVLVLDEDTVTLRCKACMAVPAEDDGMISATCFSSSKTINIRPAPSLNIVIDETAESISCMLSGGYSDKLQLRWIVNNQLLTGDLSNKIVRKVNNNYNVVTVIPLPKTGTNGVLFTCFTDDYGPHSVSQTIIWYPELYKPVTQKTIMYTIGILVIVSMCIIFCSCCCTVCFYKYKP